jgi:molybdate transport system ATP-binding protein
MTRDRFIPRLGSQKIVVFHGETSPTEGYETSCNKIDASFTKTFPQGQTISGTWQSTLHTSSCTIICGPSGSGKTTFLRCLAGLEKPTTGSIKAGSITWFDARHNINLTPKQRNIGFCFQNYALFPHLTVRQNLAFSLKNKENSHSIINQILEKFDIHNLHHRYPHELSGGEQQRVALARCLIRKPDLLLIDEPFAALDDPLKIKLRRELKTLLKDFNIPILLVTHDRNDALALADHLLIFHQGNIIMQGGVEEVFSRPASPIVAEIVGIETIVTGIVARTAADMTFVRIGNIELQSISIAPASSRVHVCLRGEDIVLTNKLDEAVSSRNHLNCIVTSITPEGPLYRIGLDCGFALFALITKQAVHELNIKIGEKITALIKAPAIHLIPY